MTSGGGTRPGSASSGAGVAPLVVVVPGRGQAEAETVAQRRIPADLVEPVARVVGVAVERFGPQPLAAHRHEADALAQHDQRQGQDLHPGPVHGGRVQRELEGHRVVQDLVVVGVDVIDRLGRGQRVPAGRAVVVDLGATQLGPGVGDEPVRGQRPGQPHLDPVVHRQRGLRAEPGGEAAHRRVAGRAAAAGRVAQPVVERADTGTGHVDLGGLGEPGVVGHLAEVPALAVQIDVATVDTVGGRGEVVEGDPDLEDVGPRVVAHQVEPEAVDLVLPGPGDHRVDHQPAHHHVLGGGVGAAGGLGGAAVGELPVVVAGDDPVEHAEPVEPVAHGVVVDHVHHHAQAGVVERGHHLAELEHPRGAGRVDGESCPRARCSARGRTPSSTRRRRRRPSRRAAARASRAGTTPGRRRARPGRRAGRARWRSRRRAAGARGSARRRRASAGAACCRPRAG